MAHAHQDVGQEHVTCHHDMSIVRTDQELGVVAQQFPQLLLNAVIALHENDEDKRYEAFCNAVSNIANIASLIKSTQNISSRDIEYMLHACDKILHEDEEQDPMHEELIDIDMAFDTQYRACLRDEAPRSSHMIAHNFPHLVLNVFIALNEENDQFERQCAFYNAINNIINIASALRSEKQIDKQEVFDILSILDTALGEHNINL